LNGDHAEASEVVQEVFVELARKADRVARHPAPVGWLYTTTRRMALRRLRTHRQREAREQAMPTIQRSDPENGPAVDWERLGPVLDAALHELREHDRLAILWRYFERRSFPEMGARLGLGENGARMRVARALERLRIRLRRRGITSTDSAIAIAIEGSAVAAAPPGLHAFVSNLVFSPVALVTPAALLLPLMNTAPAKLAITALTLGLIGTGFWIQDDRLRRLRIENQALVQQLAESEAQRAAAEESIRQGPPSAGGRDLVQEELLRLRGELARRRRQSVPDTGPDPAAKPPAPDRTARREPVRTTLQAGQSVITGGWQWTEGRRAVVISTPTSRAADDGSIQVDIESRVLLLTEPTLDDLGLGFLHDGPEGATAHRNLTGAERSELLARIEGRADVEVMGNPRFSTLNGVAGSVGMTSDDLTEATVVGMRPTVTDDGRIELELDFRTEPVPSAGDNSP
ncbi:MAG: sigma-70 family RNA polymerase sigma factor, partial [Verrucomicrobia bacterium]|nr:sigma-70 family RNA polymerase sigma factor [Verrucomicrobiota bacterium]